MRRYFHLPEDIALTDGLPAQDRVRLRAAMLAAVAQAVRSVRPVDQPAPPHAARAAPGNRAAWSGPAEESNAGPGGTPPSAGIFMLAEDAPPPAPAHSPPADAGAAPADASTAPADASAAPADASTAPADASTAPPDGSAPLPRFAPVTSGAELDANEKAARRARPTLTEVVHATTAPAVEENEAASRAIAMIVFGGDQGVNKVFESLHKAVVADVDALAVRFFGKGPDAKTANRLQFFIRMRLYFDSWSDLVRHFQELEEVRVPPLQAVLHRSAAQRLRRVIDIMTSRNHPLPSVTDSFSTRGWYFGDFKTAGFMTHALGFAVDIDASANPKIGMRTEANNPERHDPYQLAATVGVDSAFLNLGDPRKVWPFIEAMGARTADQPALSAADDPDPRTRDFFQRFAQQFEHMKQGSLGIVGSTTKDHRDKLLKLRQDYFAVLRNMAKGRPQNAAVDRFDDQRRALLAQIPGLVPEWLAAIDKEIADAFAKHPGMERLRPPTEIAADLRKANASLTAANAAETKARAAAAKAHADLWAAQGRWADALARRDRAAKPADQSKAEEQVTAAGTAVDQKLEEASHAGDALREAMRAAVTALRIRDGYVAEQKPSADPKLAPAWRWIASMRDLRKALAEPDLTTPAGLRAFEALTTGDLKHQAPVENPPLLRLLEAGYFNPSPAFDLEFFEEMTHSGFLPGATWGWGGADPMHFELLEGRNSTRAPGHIPGR
jgi:hypothetical protein